VAVVWALDHGPWTAEGSAFNGREPDQHRWDFDFGALDSFSGRVWFKPSTTWEFQVSSARLKHSEALDPGNITRTTASAGWFKQSGRDFSAVTVGFGVNATAEVTRHALFAEGTMHKGSNSLFSRFELVDLETGVLLNDAIPTGAAAHLNNAVAAFTSGGRARHPALVWLRRRPGCRPHLLRCSRCVEGTVWQSSGFVSDLLSGPAACWTYGTDVQHAHVPANEGHVARRQDEHQMSKTLAAFRTSHAHRH
jgi:hypothetical protein